VRLGRAVDCLQGSNGADVECWTQVRRGVQYQVVSLLCIGAKLSTG
jgi:hypothetical protein